MVEKFIKPLVTSVNCSPEFIFLTIWRKTSSRSRSNQKNHSTCKASSPKAIEHIVVSNNTHEPLQFVVYRREYFQPGQIPLPQIDWDIHRNGSRDTKDHPTTMVLLLFCVIDLRVLPARLIKQTPCQPILILLQLHRFFLTPETALSLPP